MLRSLWTTYFETKNKRVNTKDRNNRYASHLRRRETRIHRPKISKNARCSVSWLLRIAYFLLMIPNNRNNESSCATKNIFPLHPCSHGPNSRTFKYLWPCLSNEQQSQNKHISIGKLDSIKLELKIPCLELPDILFHSSITWVLIDKFSYLGQVKCRENINVVKAKHQTQVKECRTLFAQVITDSYA